MTITENVTLNTVNCYSCGTTFAINENLMRKFRETKETFYCPSGHPQHFKVSDADKLRTEMERKEAELRTAKCEALRERNLRETAESKVLRANRKLSRIHRGVCPRCNRTFENVARHMKEKHPSEIAGANIKKA